MSSDNRRKLSTQEKQLIVSHFSDGMSVREICRAVKRSVAVVHRVIDRYRNDKTIEAKPKTGRPRKTTSRLDRRIVNSSSKDRFRSAAEISKEFSANEGISLSRFTISRRLNEAKLEARKPATKPLISKRNRLARLKFAEEHVLWTEESWRRVHFSDESKFNLFGSDGKNYVRRKIGERLSSNCVKKSVKHGGGSIMVWGSISSEGVGPLIRLQGNINARVYQNLLRQYAIPYMKECEAKPPIFMQDNAPCHTAKTVLAYLQTEQVEVMKWPAQSPDLNPIENIWKIIGQNARRKNPKNTEELYRYVREEWHAITNDQCKKLIDSCASRCAAVINNKGLFTKY